MSKWLGTVWISVLTSFGVGIIGTVTLPEDQRWQAYYIAAPALSGLLVYLFVRQ